jgi:hypothetical protein
LRLSPPDASVADPTSPAAATTHGEHEDHDSSCDDCDSDPENGSAKNSLHDRHPSLWGCVPNRSGLNLHTELPPRGADEISSTTRHGRTGSCAAAPQVQSACDGYVVTQLATPEPAAWTAVMFCPDCNENLDDVPIS